MAGWCRKEKSEVWRKDLKKTGGAGREGKRTQTGIVFIWDAKEIGWMIMFGTQICFHEDRPSWHVVPLTPNPDLWPLRVLAETVVSDLLWQKVKSGRERGSERERCSEGRSEWWGELEGGGQIKHCSLPCECFMLVFELYICFHKWLSQSYYVVLCHCLYISLSVCVCVFSICVCMWTRDEEEEENLSRKQQHPPPLLPSTLAFILFFQLPRSHLMSV